MKNETTASKGNANPISESYTTEIAMTSIIITTAIINIHPITSLILELEKFILSNLFS
jgi:hypothetical protein